MRNLNSYSYKNNITSWARLKCPPTRRPNQAQTKVCLILQEQTLKTVPVIVSKCYYIAGYSDRYFNILFTSSIDSSDLLNLLLGRFYNQSNIFKFKLVSTRCGIHLFILILVSLDLT